MKIKNIQEENPVHCAYCYEEIWGDVHTYEVITPESRILRTFHLCNECWRSRMQFSIRRFMRKLAQKGDAYLS